MTFLLDTNVISEMRRPERANPDVRSWFELQDPVSLHLSAVSILELEIGVQRMLRKDRVQGRVLFEWLHDRILPNFGARILVLDAEIALLCASLHVPNPRPDRDAWIGATALARSLTLVTRNVRDFEPVGVGLLNPWKD